VSEDLDKVTEFEEADLTRWQEDGHKVVFKWQRDTVLIETIMCPHEGTNAACNAQRDYCLVQTFLGVYGTELNIGEVLLDGPIEIAWTAEDGDSDLDRQYACIWVTPVTDISYKAMKLALSDDW
jgi:hypothetical protein